MIDVGTRDVPQDFLFLFAREIVKACRQQVQFNLLCDVFHPLLLMDSLERLSMI